MPLRGLKRSLETGTHFAVGDVRNLGLDLNRQIETVPYPVPAEFEILYTQEEWDHWVELLDRLIEHEDAPGRSRDISDSLFCLKILDLKRAATLLTPQIKEMMKAWIKKAQFLHEYLNLLGRYCYLFSETPQQAMLKIKMTKERLYREIMADDSCNVLLNVLTFAYLSFPEFLPREKLMEYWPKLSEAFAENKFIEQLQAAAYLRILFPDNFAELDLTSERIVSERIESTKGLFGGIACCKILARPEIPGLTTWPPNQQEAASLAAPLPEQPQTLAI